MAEHKNLPPPRRLADNVSFGPFRLVVSARLLEKNGTPVNVGSRAFDILMVLVQYAGEIVSNRELVARVWRDVIVEESSLRVNMAGLRRVLNDGREGIRYITNVPGQGYTFVAPLERPQQQLPAVAMPATAPAIYPLPGKLLRMVGREGAVVQLTEQLLRDRFLTIVGPGGMGKTTTAVAIAHGLLGHFQDAVCFFDLGALVTPSLLASTMAATLGAMTTTGDAIHSLTALLQEREILLVLDSCEHLIESVAALSEHLFEQAPRVHILATSREPLRVEGERVFRLPPLDSPPAFATPTAAEAMAFPAVQLFVERAAANGSAFQFDDHDAPVVAEICRKLDGIALAIELGAGRVAAYGVRGTAQLLDNRFRLSWQGRRTALPRHQTLNAVLDWSYNLLPECERKVLRRLSVFIGHFSLDAAAEVIADIDTDAMAIIDAIGSLVAKSLASAEMGTSAMRYRLLDSARVYAVEKLRQSGESDRIACSHAAYLTALFERTYADVPTFARVGSKAHQLERLGDLRASLEWSFSETGHPITGAKLTAASAPMLLELSLLTECRAWSEKAIATLDAGGRGGKQELVLHESWAISSMFAVGNSDAVLASIQRGLELARQLGDLTHELRLLAGLNVLHTRLVGVFPETMPIVQRSLAIARELDDPAAMAMAEWMLGVACHRYADFEGAQRHCEAGIAFIAKANHPDTIFFGYDHRTRAMIVLARTLWLRGKPDQAFKVAWQAMDEAERLGHPISVCIALVYAPTVLTWNGNWQAAEALFDKQISHADKHLLGPYRAVGLGLKGELLVRRGEHAAGVDLLRQSMGLLRAGDHQTFHTVFLSALACGLAAAGQFDEALATIAPIIPSGMETFDAPEILRIQGELMASMPSPDVREAEHYLERSLTVARHQGSLGWELRTATTLARVLARQDRHAAALDVLGDVVARFTEGYTTVDYRDAMHLLEGLRNTVVRH